MSKKHVLSKVISLLLAVLLVVCCFPLQAMAETNPANPTPHFYNPDQYQWLYFGCENYWPKSISYMGGAMHPARSKVDEAPVTNQTLPMIKYSVSVNGTEYTPDENSATRKDDIQWYQADGYMNSPVSEWDAGNSGIQVKIQHIANRVLSDTATVVFTKVTLTNTTNSAITADLNVSAAADFEVPLNSVTPTTSGTGYTVYSMEVGAKTSVSREYASLSNGTASVDQLKGLTGFDANYNAVKTQYDDVLENLAQPVSLPNDEIINAYKNSMIVMWETMVKKASTDPKYTNPTLNGISNIQTSPYTQSYNLYELYSVTPTGTISGVDVETAGSLEGIHNGDYVVYPNVTFGGDYTSVTMGLAVPATYAAGGKIELYVDDEATARANISSDGNTTDWQTYQDDTADLSAAITAGTHKITLKFVNADAGESPLFNVKGLTFSGTDESQSFNLYNLYVGKDETPSAIGVEVKDSGTLEGIHNGASITYPGVTFDGNCTSVKMGFAVPTANAAGGEAKIFIDNEDTPRATITASQGSNTNDWSNYQDFDSMLSTPITAGTHTIKIVFVNTSTENFLFNVKGMTFSGSKSATVSPTSQSFNLYDLFQRTDNEGAQLGVDVKEGGTLEGIQNGDYVVYPNVTFDGDYTSVTMGLAVPTANAAGGTVELYVDEEATARASVSLYTDTGAWQTYQDVTANLSAPITAGTHTIKIVFVNTSTGNFLFNVKGMTFSVAAPTKEGYTTLGMLEVPAGTTSLTMRVDADTKNASYDFAVLNANGTTIGEAALAKDAASKDVTIAISKVTEAATVYLAYKTTASTVYDYEMRGSGGNTVGYYNYDRYFSHDVPNMVEQYIRDGYKDLAIRIMESPYYQELAYEPDQNYLDAIPKYIIPYATLWQTMSETERTAYFTDSVKNQIKAAAEKIASYMTGPNGLMAKSNTLDNGSDYLLVDNLAVLHGYATYAYLCDAWSWTDEKSWADERLQTLNTALNKKLDEFMTNQNVQWYMAALDADCSIWKRHISGEVVYDGNWLGTSFQMSTFPWDAVLRGFDLKGTWDTYFDASLDNAFELRDSRGGDIPEGSWGAWWGHEYGQCYNVGMSIGTLYSEKYRTLTVESYEWLMDNQSSPLMWGESFDKGTRENDWTRPAVDLETWGLGFMRQGLLEATASVTTDGDVIVGRGIPDNWLVSDKPIEWKHIQINDGKELTQLKIETSPDKKTITLTLVGDNVTGDVIFNLPVFVNNIASANVGAVDHEAGTVTCSGSTKSVVVTLTNAVPTELAQAELSDVQQNDDGNMVLTWNAVEGATEYAVTISDGQNEKTVTVNETTTSYTWTEGLPYVAYSCKVTAKNAAQTGKPSAAKTITLTAPNQAASAATVSSAMVDAVIAQLNLTETGKTDWLKTGSENAPYTIYKKDANRLQYYVLANASDNKWLDDSHIAFNWSDGAPTQSGQNVITGNCVCANHGSTLTGESKAWLLNLPVNNKVQTLDLYVQTWNSTTRFDVYGSDSATVLASETLSSSNDAVALKKLSITINNSTASNLSLQVVATITEKDGLWGNTALLAATLNEKDPTTVVNVTGVTLNTASTALTVGETETLTATVAPTEATNKNVTWSSDNENVATVDQTGKVTAVAAGTATITVTTEDGSETASCEVTVHAAAVAVTVVNLNKISTTLTVGETETLTATVAPNDATNKNVTWSSGNEAVATVDQTGKVTAVAAGTATITVTTEDGRKTAACAVTVTKAADPTTPTNPSNPSKPSQPSKPAEPTTPVTPSGFRDVARSDWFYSSVQWAVEEGLMNGVGNNRFDPNGNTSRAMVLTMLYRQAGSPNATGKGAWYADAQKWAMATGISDGSNMMGNITREQLATMLWRQAGSPKADTSVLNNYADGAKVSDYAKQAVAWAISQGILSGKGQNNLDPTGAATRAETAAMFKRFFG